MSLNQPIKDLEKVESIPQGTAYVASMGNGSGVKAVTQEVLTQAVGEGLKIGDLEELETDNKESIVAAINEAAQSGGGGAAVDILDSEEEIEANTEEGKVAGALALKEMFSALNDNLNDLIKAKVESANAPAANQNTDYNVNIPINAPEGYTFLGVGAIACSTWGQTLRSYSVNNNNLTVNFYNGYSTNVSASPNAIRATMFFIKDQ